MGGAIPFNGGSYLAAMSTYSKRTASVLACCSVLSYVATSVMSARSGSSYLLTIFDVKSDLAVDLTTAAVIISVGLVVFWGLKESAKMATVIFCLHMTVLFILIVHSIIYLSEGNTHYLSKLFTEALPHQWAVSFLYGFSTGMLGITGYETACNYVESQAPGVYEVLTHSQTPMTRQDCMHLCCTAQRVPVRVAVRRRVRSLRRSGAVGGNHR